MYIDVHSRLWKAVRPSSLRKRGAFGAGSSRITEADNQETVGLAAANTHHEHEGHAQKIRKEKKTPRRARAADGAIRSTQTRKETPNRNRPFALAASQPLGAAARMTSRGNRKNQTPPAAAAESASSEGGEPDRAEPSAGAPGGQTCWRWRRSSPRGQPPAATRHGPATRVWARKDKGKTKKQRKEGSRRNQSQRP
jgi:hypothetical protein